MGTDGKSTGAAPVAVQPSRTLWRMAGLLCAAWVLSLALLVFRTANPLTLNTAQVKFSSWIVEAGVRQLHPGKVEVVIVITLSQKPKSTQT